MRILGVGVLAFGLAWIVVEVVLRASGLGAMLPVGAARLAHLLTVVVLGGAAVVYAGNASESRQMSVILALLAGWAGLIAVVALLQWVGALTAEATLSGGIRLALAGGKIVVGGSPARVSLDGFAIPWAITGGVMAGSVWRLRNGLSGIAGRTEAGRAVLPVILAVLGGGVGAVASQIAFLLGLAVAPGIGLEALGAIASAAAANEESLRDEVLGVVGLLPGVGLLVGAAAGYAAGLRRLRQAGSGPGAA